MRLEKQTKTGLLSKKNLKTWEIFLDSGYKDIKEEEKKRIEEIKTRKVRHPDGDFYSEKDEHFFIVVVPVVSLTN